MRDGHGEPKGEAKRPRRVAFGAVSTPACQVPAESGRGGGLAATGARAESVGKAEARGSLEAVERRTSREAIREQVYS
jgi:hypothetical protein